MNWRAKSVVITGASSGIGEALAKAFAARGANVTMGARRTDKLQHIAKQINSAAGGRATFTTTDVTDPESCRALVETAVREFGGIDVLVCNAGVSMRALFDEVDLEVLHRSMDTNFWGTVYTTKAALPYIQRSRGTIVGISSVAGLHGLPCRTGYSASKYAMTGFLETLRIENLKKGVHVMIACPGFTATEVRLHSMMADGSEQGRSPRNEGRMMSADEVAGRIIRGIEHRRRLLTMEYEGRLTLLLKPVATRLLDKIYYREMAAESDSPLR